MKWLALGLIVLAALAFIRSYRMTDKATFESGSFLVVIALFVLGIISGISGGFLFLLALFRLL